MFLLNVYRKSFNQVFIITFFFLVKTQHETGTRATAAAHANPQSVAFRNVFGCLNMRNLIQSKLRNGKR